jgi:DNA-binding response OmpR family regulator
MKPSILLVEDDVNLGFIICDELKLQGYDVKLCMDGVEAMQEFHNRTYHLCVFDVMMPRKDGFTLAKEIRATDVDIPILFLTAKSTALVVPKSSSMQKALTPLKSNPECLKAA